MDSKGALYGLPARNFFLESNLNSFKSRSAPNRSMALIIGFSGTKIVMKTTFKLHLACLALVFLSFTAPSVADTEKRIAFVVGNSAYQAGQLATSANDAGLIAQTLQAAGFDVTGSRSRWRILARGIPGLSRQGAGFRAG